MPTEYGSVPTGDTPPTSFTKKRRCNDILFAVLFLAHLVLIVMSWWTYSTTETEYFKDYADKGVWKFVGATAGFALALSTLTLFFSKSQNVQKMVNVFFTP